MLPAIGLAAPKVELAPNPPPKLVLAPKAPVVELPAPNVVFDGFTKPPPKEVLPAPKAEADAGAPKEPAAPRLPKVAVGAAVPSAKVGGPA